MPTLTDATLETAFTGMVVLRLILLFGEGAIWLSKQDSTYRAMGTAWHILIAGYGLLKLLIDKVITRWKS